PAFPFNLLNYAFGLTRVSLRDYVLASWVGMMPGTVMYVYLGSLAGDLAGAGRRERTAAEWTLYAVGLAATVAVTVLVTRLARRAPAARADLAGATAGRAAQSSRGTSTTRPSPPTCTPMGGPRPSRRRATTWW